MRRWPPPRRPSPATASWPPTTPPTCPDLAMALTNLGVRYRELGRPDEALAPTEEAVAGYRELAADNPAHLPRPGHGADQPRRLLQRAGPAR